MIRQFRAMAAALVLSATAAGAGNICQPDRGSPLRVTGVPAGEALTVRDGPGPRHRRVGDLLPGQRDARATGRVQYLSRRCAAACADLVDGFGGGGLVAAIDRDCRAEGRIWYEVSTSRGLTGWSSARHLALPGAAVPPVAVLPPRPLPVPRPPEPPASDGVLRFACRDGDRIAVVVAPGGLTATVTDRRGQTWQTERVREGPTFLNFYATVPGGLLLTGTARSVRWQSPGRAATLCTGTG